MSEPSMRLFTYLENFNRAETFRKSLEHSKEQRTSSCAEKKLWKFQRDLNLYLNFLLNFAELFFADVRGGVLLPE